MLLYNEDLRRAHRLKERFYDLCQNPKYSIQRKEFWEWIQEAERSGVKEFEKCAATYRNWSKGILNAFKYGITNGPTEGFNNRIKVLKRTSYGIRNFERFRTRILHCTRLFHTKQQTGTEVSFVYPFFIKIKPYVKKVNVKSFASL